MASYGMSPFTEENIPQLVGIKTNIERYFFDAFLKVDNTSKLTITSHPVEEGANIADHAYLEPQTITMEIGMSDACVSYVAGQFQQKYTRSVSAYDTLLKLQAERKPLTVHTRLKTYKNMLIENITAPDDYTTLFGLRVTVTLTEIITAKTQTVTIENKTSAEPQKTGTTKKGTVQPIPKKNISKPVQKKVEEKVDNRTIADTITPNFIRDFIPETWK